jgi:hypothetical protein
MKYGCTTALILTFSPRRRNSGDDFELSDDATAKPVASFAQRKYGTRKVLLPRRLHSTRKRTWHRDVARRSIQRWFSAGNERYPAPESRHSLDATPLYGQPVARPENEHLELAVHPDFPREYGKKHPRRARYPNSESGFKALSSSRVSADRASRRNRAPASRRPPR